MNAAEKKIADFLDEVGIKYIYENPILIEQEYKSGGKPKKFLRIFYPDFYLSEFGVILEFWGMHEQDEYSKVMEKKKEDYYFNWIFVINVYNLEGNWKDYILNKIRDVSEHRLKIINRAKDKFKEWPAEKKEGDKEYYEARRKQLAQQGQKPPAKPARPPRGKGQRRSRSRGRRPRSRANSQQKTQQQPKAPQQPPKIGTAMQKSEQKPEQKSAPKPASKKRSSRRPSAKKTEQKPPAKPAEKKAVKKTVKKAVKKKAAKKPAKQEEKKGLLTKLFKKD